MPVKLGINIPNSGPVVDELGLAAMGSAAEEAGATSLWVSDHLLLVEGDTSVYPYDDSSRQTWANDIDYYEALISCTHLAAFTHRCRIGTSALVLPQRHVLELAKMSSTLDRLSSGRFVLGVGVGWNRSEMEALGYSFGQRGERFEAMLRVLRDCWTGEPEPTIEGGVVVASHVMLYPRPVQPHGVPLLVAGGSRAALRRAAELGDGWLAIAFDDQIDREQLARDLGLIDTLRRQTNIDRPFDKVLKLHRRGERAQNQLSALAAVCGLGFDEVAIDLPWEHGIDAAIETYERAVAVVRRGPEVARS